MPRSPSVTLPRPPRSLRFNQSVWDAALTDARERAGANRRASERSRRAQARQHDLVATWLRELVRHQ
jgi:hypothetical protein